MRWDGRRRAAALFAGATTALVFGGCGGGSHATTASRSAAPSSTGTTATASAPAQADAATSFNAQAETICRQANAAILAQRPARVTATEVERVVPHTIVLELGAAAALERLKPPTALAGDWRRMLAYRRTLARELSELVSAAKKNDGAVAQTLAASKKRAHASLAAIAKRDGFEECAKVGRAG